MSGWLSPAEIASALATGTGSGLRIAVLDSGIEIAHPDFAGRTLSDDLIVELDNFTPAHGADPYGHGTAIAGIIWEVAPRAEIGSFRVLGPDLKSRSALVSRAAQKAIDLGYHIINCSFACGIPSHLALYKTWVDRAALGGQSIVAASSSHDSNHPEWPAHFPSVIAVDCALSEKLSHRSGSLIEFSAPASERRVPWRDGSHRSMTGSSFAAAHVSGLLARLLSARASHDALLTKALLRQFARSGPSRQRTPVGS